MEDMYIANSNVSVETKDMKATKDRLVAYATKISESFAKKSEENKEEE